MSARRYVVATEDEIPPGGRKIVTLERREIGIFNVDGEYFALRNRCPHQGAALCEGHVLPALESSGPGDQRLAPGPPAAVPVARLGVRRALRAELVRARIGCAFARTPSAWSRPAEASRFPGLVPGPHVAETYPVRRRGAPRRRGPRRVSAAAADARLDAFRPLRVQRAGDDVLAVLVDAIRGGLYRPGDHLPTQVELAAQLGVSRGVVREAMMALRRAGVVSVRRGRGGTVVASLEHLDDVLVQIRGQTRETLRAVLEARRVLESAAAPLAAKRAKRSDWRELRALAGQLEALTEDPGLFVRTDAAFHVAIARLSGNALLERFLRETFDEVIATTARLPVGRISTTAAIAMQHDLLAALESRDAAAIARAIDDHLAPLERALVGRRLSAGCQLTA